MLNSYVKTNSAKHVVETTQFIKPRWRENCEKQQKMVHLKDCLQGEENMKILNSGTKISTIISILLLTIAMLTLSSCGQASVDAEKSPHLADIKLTSYSENTEDTQYVQVDMIFDKDIAVVDDKCESLRITIADERIGEDEYTLTSGEDSQTATIKISVNAVTKGVLKIDKLKENQTISEIRSADEKYAAADFSVEAIIPSGVTLSTTESATGHVVKNVDTFWNIRSIAWVGITENGELVPVSETRQLEMLDGYAAVHGHEFLMEDQSDIAASIAEVLKQNYGSEYTVSSQKNTITVDKAGSDVTLDVVIYQYIKINDRLINE